MLASCLLPVREASAQQSQSPRPFQGLFGAAEGGGSRTQRLELTTSLFGGYDSNLAAPTGSAGGFGGPLVLPPGAIRLAPGAPWLPTPSPSTDAAVSSGVYGASTALSYVHRWRHSTLNAYGSGSLSEYPSIGNRQRAAFSTGLGFSTPIGRRNSLQVMQTVARVPYYSLAQIFPDLPPLDGLDVPVETPSFDLALVPASAYQMLTNATLSRHLSRRSSLEFFFSRHGTVFTGDSPSGYLDTSDARGGVRFVRGLSRNVSLRLGYAYRVGRYRATARSYDSHEIDAGIDYSRSFTLWRRTKFAFTTGSSVLADQPIAEDVNPRTRVFLTGTAMLVREFLRSWSARVQYNRGINYLDGFASPFLTDAATFGVGGLVTRRIRVHAGGSGSFGQVGLANERGRNHFHTWTLFSTADLAFTRHLATYVSYFYYRYKIESGVLLPAGIPGGYERNGVRAGLRVWVPVI